VYLGQSPDSRTYNNQGEGWPFLQGNAEFGARRPTHRLYCTAPNRLCDEGDILLSVRAPVGATNQADRTYAIGRELAAIRFAEHDRGFGWHTLRHAVPQLELLAQGSTFTAVSRKEIEELLISFPEEGARTAITGILDTFESAIEQTEALLAKWQRIKTGLMHDLLTRGLDAKGRLRNPSTHRFKDSPLGLIPEEWEVRALAEVVPSNRPIVYGILMPGEYFEGGVPVIKVKDIQGGMILLGGLLKTEPRIDASYSRSRVRSGDLLFTIRGSVGRMAVVPSELDGANITQDTARITVATGNTTFVRHCLEMPSQRAFIELHTIGQAVKGINLREVRKIIIQFPKPDERHEIARRLDTHERDTRILIDHLTKLRGLKTGLMQDLLTGRVPVTLLLSDVVL
jgi:type I restriction enzyme S subunit